jgi:hypothetical protein
MPSPRGHLFRRVWRLASPKGIPELTSLSSEEIFRVVSAVSVVCQHRSEVLPIGFDSQQVLGHAALSNNSRAEDKVANRSLI